MPAIKVLIKCYDQAGHRVEELIEQELPPEHSSEMDIQALASKLYNDQKPDMWQRQPFKCFVCGEKATDQSGCSIPGDFDHNCPGTSCIYHALPFCGYTASGCVTKLVGDVLKFKRPGHDFDPVDKAGKICYNCGNVAELKTCSQCHLAKYCSKNCRPAHRMECQQMALYQALRNSRRPA